MLVAASTSARTLFSQSAHERKKAMTPTLAK
jgi:hypothetical protein